ncbi:MAG: sulfurtransferase TusA family protein [Succinivibrio sp.]
MEKIVLDCRGMCCPEPLTMLRNAVRKAQVGQVFELLSDDPVSLRDVPAFCNFMKHKLVSMPDQNSPHTFTIEKLH